MCFFYVDTFAKAIQKLKKAQVQTDLDTTDVEEKRPKFAVERFSNQFYSAKKDTAMAIESACNNLELIPLETDLLDENTNLSSTPKLFDRRSLQSMTNCDSESWDSPPPLKKPKSRDNMVQSE
jgi:hypothetical protein